MFRTWCLETWQVFLKKKKEKRNLEGKSYFNSCWFLQNSIWGFQCLSFARSSPELTPGFEVWCQQCPVQRDSPCPGPAARITIADPGQVPSAFSAIWAHLAHAQLLLTTLTRSFSTRQLPRHCSPKLEHCWVVTQHFTWLNLIALAHGPACPDPSAESCCPPAHQPFHPVLCHLQMYWGCTQVLSSISRKSVLQLSFPRQHLTLFFSPFSAKIRNPTALTSLFSTTCNKKGDERSLGWALQYRPNPELQMWELGELLSVLSVESTNVFCGSGYQQCPGLSYH